MRYKLAAALLSGALCLQTAVPAIAADTWTVRETTETEEGWDTDWEVIDPSGTEEQWSETEEEWSETEEQWSETEEEWPETEEEWSETEEEWSETEEEWSETEEEWPETEEQWSEAEEDFITDPGADEWTAADAAAGAADEAVEVSLFYADEDLSYNGL